MSFPIYIHFLNGLIHKVCKENITCTKIFSGSQLHQKKVNKQGIPDDGDSADINFDMVHCPEIV
jgi:hypothetical protein